MSQSSHQLSPPYRLINRGLNESRVIPFLGAGASLHRHDLNNATREVSSAHLPTATELAGYLAQQTEFPEDETLDLAKVAQYYNVIGGRAPLYQALHAIFDCDYPLTPLQLFLANVNAPLLIVTTNYDDLIERAFKERGHRYDVVIHTCDQSIGDRLLWWRYGLDEPRPVNPNKLDIDLRNVTVIYKMHGAVDRRVPDRDQYVITEDDYIDFLARMTKNRAIPAIFAEAFQYRHFLFLGYSLRDWNLRVVLNRIQADLRRPMDITSWAIQYKPSLMERRFWQRRGVEVYDMTLDDFVSELESRL